MKPSITYLHLLRYTPFFAELTTDQLQWVIQHSREWEVHAGDTIVDGHKPDEGAGHWILLDGGWDLEIEGLHHASGHADPGKWLDRRLIEPHPFKLMANDHGYVMHITAQDMTEMLAEGFPFDDHLASGKAFYKKFNTHVPSPCFQA